MRYEGRAGSGLEGGFDFLVRRGKFLKMSRLPVMQTGADSAQAEPFVTLAARGSC